MEELQPPKKRTISDLTAAKLTALQELQGLKHRREEIKKERQQKSKKASGKDEAKEATGSTAAGGKENADPGAQNGEATSSTDANSTASTALTRKQMMFKFAGSTRASAAEVEAEIQERRQALKLWVADLAEMKEHRNKTLSILERLAEKF